MANPVESLASIDSSVPTSSTKRRVQIFRDEIPSILSGSEMTTEMASVLVDLIFKTLFVYDDRGSVKAVDDVVIKSLRQVAFMKSFAATLVQVMEKNLKFQSHIGCHRLLKWSCLLLTESEFSSASKNAFCRVAQVQASILHIGMQGSLRVRRACKQTFFFLFSKLPDIYGSYMEELRDSRISYKDCPEIVLLMLEYSTLNPSLFEKWKQVFLDMYTKVVLNAREKPPRGLSEAFFPLFTHLSHEDFKSTVIPLSVKMLKRNPELVLESVAILLQSANLDLSKYAVEMLAVVLTQARHTDEGRKTTALSIIRCLSTKSSSPDALEEMFKAVKSVIGGSEGRLTFPYQRVGMINALQEMSNAPEGKYLTSLSKTICSFLLSCYKDDGNEEVKLAILSCFASWAARCADAIDQGVVSFISNGLKEKETLRKGHLRCVRLICKNIDAVPRISSLLAPLLQLVKTGFTKVAQRLDGIYALFCVAKIAAIDVKADETVMKEKIWALISQNEPSLVPITMASKLPIEDCMACHDLFEALLIDHPQRMLETFPVSTFVQFILFVLCHPSWAVRRAAYNSVKKIIAAIPQLSEAIMLEFSNYLSAVGEKVLLKTSDTDSLSDNQVPVLPSVEVLVKALVVLSPATLSAVPHVCKQILFCSHNPCLIGSAKRNAVWRRVHKCLQRQGFDVVHLLSTDVAGLCQGLLGSRGLMSQNHFEQEAAINSFSTLMSIIPGETYTEFVKNFNDLPDRHAHDMFSENDIQAFSCLCYFIQIFRTPEGMLSTEQGVYIAESISSKNTKQPKGRFRVYDSNDDLDKGNSNRLQRHELSSKDATVVGKKDGGKSTKKSDKDKDKGKTAKEEARDMQLREEACIRERVMVVQNNLSSMLKALGEMAIANHVFTHSQLPYLFKVIDPLLCSPIVGDVAYDALVKLSNCVSSPLSNWALEIATALRLIRTEDANVLWALFPSASEEANEKPGLFVRVVNGLSFSCKSGSLPVDSFTFVFPIMERILLSSKKTRLHEDVLQIIFLHLDPVLPLPRVRMLSVLYHVLGVVPAYQASIGPSLNELCLGLSAAEVAPALSGVYAKDVHVRMACLNAVKCVPALAGHSIPENIEVATSIWLALHDPEKSVAEAAEDIWDHYGYDLGTDYSGIFKAFSNINFNVRVAAAEALAAALDENPDTIQESLSTLFSLYIRDAGFSEDNIDAGWIGRQGIALALHSVADVLRTKDLPVVMTFLISRALADPNVDVRGRMINAGILIIDKHGNDNVSLLFPIFENYLNKKASDEEKYDLVREGVVIFTGALAKHLAKDDPKVHAVVEKLLDVLNTPSEAVQRAVSSCLSPLMQSKQEDAPALVSRLLDKLMKSDKYGERRGAAFGLGGVVKGFKISCIKKYGIITTLREGFLDRNSAKCREGALLAFECFCETLGKLFEPYVIQMLPLLLVSFSDQVVAVREAAECAARAMMSQLTAQGVKLILPSLLKGLEDKAWRTKQSSVQLLGAMAYCAPQQLSQCLPKIVPKLTEVLTDTHPKVQSAGQTALQQVGSVIKNPEISALVPTLLMGLTEPNEHTKYSLDILLQTTFINTIDAPSLALLVPIVHRGLRERSAETKKKAAQIVGNMCSLVTEPKDMIPYIGLLLPEVKKVLLDPIPEVRSVAARAIGSLIRGMGEENFPDLVPWLLDTLKSDGSNVERSGAAQGLSEGVCIGLSEVMASAGKNQLLSFMDKLIPTIRTALCDSMPEVRESAGLAFSTLYKTAGMQAIDEIVPTLLHALEDDQTSDTALDGLKQILSVRTSAVLPHILPKLVHLPLSAFNAHALGALAEVAGTGLDAHLGTILPALLTAMGYTDMEVQSLAKKAAETVVTVIDEEGIESLLSELLKGVGDSQASIRQSSAYLIGYLFKTSDLYLVDEAPNLISTLIILLSDSDSATVTVAWEALSSVIRSVPKEVLPSYIKLVRDAVSTSRDKERRKKKGGPVLIPGFCLRKALQPVLPIFLQGLISGSAELREQAALGLGELIEVTSEQALKEFVIPITGPLIRIIGDRFPWQVKSAILSTLSIIIRKGGLALKPFLPQLQTTFVKCLQDNTRTVRSSAALALGKLSALTTRIDPLVGDLLSALQQASDVGIREAILTALKGVIKHAGKSVSSASRTRVYTLLKDLIYNDDDQIRICAASILGIISQYLEDEEVLDLLNEITNSASSSTWCTRHGAVLTISSMLKHSPAIICTSSSYGAVVNCLKSSLKDEKFPIRETSTRAFGRLLCHQIQSDSSNASSHLEILGSIVSAMQDDSSEVRRRALSSLKIAAKSNPSDVMIHVSKYGPVLAECMKDASTPVRVAAERCALHAFQLTKSADNVQAAQKFITGLDARRIAKLPEYSDVSEDSDIDTSSG
ncbi:PREDICTED: eIF-2-alpha kinase activator GCN1 isoform X18 [Ipomoea nil]|uniref:eIF-2-alpha kinase activator GCN1 isoform X18 n=1 Tax=Ipomoea nil TaxID=35883 RepID=UPI000901B7A6|nr:PREDICTED: eIF-2-alpha kinase activator GCN1 isoform X18 [Ipomoea nil]